MITESAEVEVGAEAKENEKSEIGSSKTELYEDRLRTADTDGQDYEVGICMLLFLRGLRYCSYFRLASNHSLAGDFDNAVFVYKNVNQEHYKAVLVQMKHKRRTKITIRKLIAHKNGLSVRKYFSSFVANCDYWRSFDVDGIVRPLKEVMYVLYSNAPADSSLPGIEVVDPSFAHLLCTSGKCVRFRFEDIKDAFADGSDVVDSVLMSKRYDFLESFVLCHSQGGHEDLDACIGEEIRHLLGCGDGDIPVIKEKLKCGFKAWWAEYESQVPWMSKDFSIWKDIIRSRVERFGEPYDWKKLRVDLRFSESCLKKVRSLIRQTKQLALLVEDKHEARLACKKVQNAVGTNCLAVASDIFQSNSDEIANLNNLGAFRVLVVVALDGLSQIDDRCLRDIAGTPGGRVVLICRDATKTWSTEFGGTGFHDLDVTSAGKLLEQVIDLQGSKFRLKDLTPDLDAFTSRLNASHLIELSGDIVTMGQVLNDPIPYYVPRRLIRRNLLDKAFFSALKPSEESCIVFGEMDVLRHLRLRRGFSQDCIGTTLPETYKSDCIILLTEVKAYDYFLKIKLDNVRVRSVHLVKYNNGKFFWLMSHGDETTVKNHLIPQYISCPFDTNDTEIIINGCGGMGKSVWMEYVAAKRKENPTWVLKVDVTDKSLTESNFDNEEQIKDFLVNNCSSSGRRPGNLEDTLLRYSLDFVGNVLIFVDKLDVLNAGNAEKVLHLLSTLPKVKHSKFVVATIPEQKDRIEQVLRTFAYDLEPFNDNEKSQFLRNFWRYKGIKYGVDEETAKIKDIFHNLGPCLSIPLMAYTTQMTFLSSLSREYQRLRNPTPYLYSMMVEIELKDLLITKLGLKDPSDGEFIKKSFSEDLMKLAATIYVPDDQLKKRKFEFDSETLSNNRFGLIDCKDGKVYFRHRSFSEYFFAMWLKSNDSDERLLKENLFKINADFVRQCFGSFYIEKCDLHAAVADDDIERVKRFLNRKHDIDGAGRTALHVAAMNTSRNAREIAQLLLNVGVRIDAVDSLMKCNALQFALAASNWGVADLLLATKHFRGSKYARNLVGRFENYVSVFRKFCLQGYVELVRCMVKLDENLLKQKYGVSRDSALHLAAKSGNTELVQWLLDRDDNVSANDDGLTPASVAAREGHVDVLRVLRNNGVSLDEGDAVRPLHEAALRNRVDALTYLISEGVDVEARDSSQETALHYASREGHLELVRHLLIIGKARVNSVNGSQETPLHCAALRGHSAMVEALLDAGANKVARSASDETPLHYAASRGHIDVVNVLVSRGADMNAKDAKGRTPLHCAARYKHGSVVNALIGAGASVNAKDECGMTPLHHAAYEGLSKDDGYQLRRLWSRDEVLPDDAHRVPCHSGIPVTKDIVEALLMAGADVNAVDNQQLTPATYSRDETIQQMLQGDGAHDDLARFSLTLMPGSRSGVII